MFKLRITKAEWEALTEHQRQLYVVDGDGYKLPLADDPTIELQSVRAELETLRRTNSELTEKSKTRKARIAELEPLQAANAALQTQVNTLTVDVPLRHMAEKLSKDVDLFIEQFSKNYKVKLVDNKLTLHSVEDDKTLSIPFEEEALRKMLIDPNHPNASFYSKFVIASRASGASTTKQHTAQAPKPAIQFGLR